MSNGYGVQQGATLAAAANMMQRPRTAPQQRVQPRYAPNVMAQVSQVSVPNMGMTGMTSVPMSMSSIPMTGMLPAAKMRNTPSASMTPPRKNRPYEAHTPYRKNDDEPVGYYGVNMGWGTSPKKRRKYILVQKNTSIY